MSTVMISRKTAANKLPDLPVPAQARKTLITLADSLLIELYDLYHLPMDTSAAHLRQRLSTLLTAFEDQAKLAGIPALKVLTARYILCAVLDEAILQSHWGQQFHWGENSLLSLFHNDTWGGEQFFVILDKALADQEPNLDILELLYVCLALGFQGQYRVAAKGLQQLERLRSELWHILNAHYQYSSLTLSFATNVKNVKAAKKRNPLYIWLLLISACLILVSSVYGVLQSELTTIAHDLASQLEQAVVQQTTLNNLQGET